MSRIKALHRTQVAEAIPTQVPAPSFFDAMPDCAYLREVQLVRSERNPTAPLPFSAATLWRMVAAKTFPAPVKLGQRVTAWRCGDVRRWMVGAAGSK